MSEIAKEGLTIISKDSGVTLVAIVTDALQVCRYSNGRVTSITLSLCIIAM